MKIKLKRSWRPTYCSPGSGLDYYDKDGGWGLCYSDLNEYFDLDDSPDEITVILSKTEIKDSYFIKLIESGFGYNITLSDGSLEPEGATLLGRAVIGKFGPAWVAIEA